MYKENLNFNIYKGTFLISTLVQGKFKILIVIWFYQFKKKKKKVYIFFPKKKNR